MSSADSKAYRYTLHDWTRKMHREVPKYDDKWNGKEWTSTVKIGGTIEGEGTGNDKKAAEENAAKAALRKCGIAV
ncbi:hypothetical protein F5887DRAFT_1285476 [Amanita rubescens]|nr:hypothetical protein F5887DRAFT_1285476 [Amanita rubescens]